MASKNNQYNLFEEGDLKHDQSKASEKVEEPAMLESLQLTGHDTKKESKLKKLISSRLKKIEKLNSLFENDKKTLNKLKDLYHKNLSEDIKDHSKALEDYNEKLIKRYGQKSFPNYQKDLMEYLIEENFEELYFNNYQNENIERLINEYNELKGKYNGFYEEDYDEEDWHDEGGDFEFEDDEFDNKFEGDEFTDQFAKELITEMLNNMGIEVDDDFFQGLDPRAPDFNDKFQERLYEYSEKQKRTQKAEDKKNKIATTDKEFAKLYKLLVKKVHPDLTTDDVERQRRELLMKELSSVWDKRDYYELMMFQSKIDPELNNGMELNQKQLQKIADDLLEKSRKIEADRFMLKKDPENEFYLQNFYAKSDKKIHSHIEKYALKLRKEKQEINNNIQKLKNQKTAKDFLRATNEKMEEDFYNDFWF